MNVWDEWQLSWRDAGRCGPQDSLPSVGINVVIKRHPATTMRSGTEGCTSISGQSQGIIRNYWDHQLTNGEDAGWSAWHIALAAGRGSCREGCGEVRVDLQHAIKSQNRQGAEHTGG